MVMDEIADHGTKARLASARGALMKSASITDYQFTSLLSTTAMRSNGSRPGSPRHPGCRLMLGRQPAAQNRAEEEREEIGTDVPWPMFGAPVQALDSDFIAI